LVAVVDLMADLTTGPVSSSSAQVQPKKEDVLVTILETPNGFLRVRSGPLIASDEIGQVHPGEKYKFLKVDSKTGWYQIQFTASSSGWISNTYAATGSGTIKN